MYCIQSEKIAGLQLSEAHNIYNTVLSGYNKFVRPVKDDKTVTRVRMQPALYSIDKIVSMTQYNRLSMMMMERKLRYLKHETE